MALPAAPAWRRFAADVGLWAAIGVVMAFLGPFGSAERTLPERLLYWQICMVGGGLIGVGIDAPIRRATDRFWPRLLVVSVAMTPPVVVLVAAANSGLAGMRLSWANVLAPWFQVFVVCFAAMLVRQLVWTSPPAASAGAPQPAGDPLATFRQRLSAKRRAAELIAVEAEDHYLRVHTDAGEELITARFGDALDELAAAPGFRTHRSWWVAADAIDEVRWSRGRGEARLKCGLVVPVSRSQAPALKQAGWF
jgi:hypothetical protein